MDFSEVISKLWSSISGYIWFVVLAVWGGSVNYVSRVRNDKAIKFSFTELLVEWVISAFAGLSAAFICMEYGLSWHVTACIAGITGHMGGRAIFVFEAYGKKKLSMLLGKIDWPSENKKDDHDK